MTEKKKKLEQAESTPRPSQFLSIHQLKDGKLNLSARDYCIRFAIDEEWERLEKEVVERRSKIPAYSFWRCPGCGAVTRLDGEAPEKYRDDPVQCFKCNSYGSKDAKGWLIGMSKKEIAKHFEDEKTVAARRHERDVKADLYHRNENRQKQGLEPFTMAQFKEAQAREYREKIRMQAGLKK